MSYSRVNNVLLSSIPVGLSPLNIVSSLDGKYVFVQNDYGSSITPINVDLRKARNAIPLGGFAPIDLAVSPDGKYLYIAATFRVFVVDIALWKQLCDFDGAALDCSLPAIKRNDALPSPPPPPSCAMEMQINFFNTAIGLSPDNGTLYVAALNYRRFGVPAPSQECPTGDVNLVYAFNAAPYPTSGPSGAGVLRTGIYTEIRAPSDIAFSLDSKRAFIGIGSAFMTVDTKNDWLEQAMLTMPAGLIELRTRPAAGILYGPDVSNARLFKFANDRFMTQLTPPIPLFKSNESLGTYLAMGVDFGPSGQSAYVSLYGAPSKVRSIDLVTETIGPINVSLPAWAWPARIAAPAAPPPPPPAVTVELPPAGATVSDPRQRIQVAYTKTAEDLNLNELTLTLDGSPTAPVVDATYSNGTGIGPITTESQSLTSPLSGHQMVASNGFAYVIGGANVYGGGTSNQVFKSAIGPNGDLGPWQPTTPLPVPVGNSGAVASRNFLYVMDPAGVFFTSLQAGGDPNPWESASPLAVPVSRFGSAISVRFDDFLYVIGGAERGTIVQFTRIDQSGAPGEWVETNPLPIPLRDISAVEWNGRLYVMGGLTNQVLSAKIDRSGHLGEWVTVANLPRFCERGTAVVSNGQIIYLGGGCIDPIQDYGASNLVFFTTIKENGTLELWQTSAKALPQTRCDWDAAVSGNRVYAAGGASYYPLNIHSDVLRADIQSGGPIFARATFIPPTPLGTGGPHTVAATIRDVQGNKGSTSSSFFVSPAPRTWYAGAGTLFSFDPYLSFGVKLADEQPVERDIALMGQGLTNPSELMYEISRAAEFDTPATLTISWKDNDPEDGIIDGTNVSEADLEMRKFNGQAWVLVPEIENNPLQNFIKGELFSASLFALFAPERVPPTVSIVKPANGLVVTTLSTPFVLATYSDNSRIDLARVRVFLDDLDVSTQAAIMASSATYMPAALPAGGPHVVTVSVADVAGNAAAASSSFTVTRDVLPPRTSVTIGAPKFPDAITFISSKTALSLTAVDDATTVGDGAGVGVAETRFAIDAGTFAVFTTSFFIVSEGAHTIRFFSVDNVGNIEVTKSSAVAVDNTPPTTQLVIQDFQKVIGGAIFISTDALFGFAAQDPVVNGVTSGAKATLFSIDGGPFNVFVASFSLAAGTHTLTFQSADNVDNREAPQTTSFTIRTRDTLPPRTVLNIGQPQFGTDPVFITSSTSLSFTAVDDAVRAGDGAGFGVAETRFAIDSGPFILFTGSFTIVEEGTHTVRFFSFDLIGNTETVKTRNIAVDNTPPLTFVTVDGFTVATGTVTVFTTSSLGFKAEDPVIQGAASGVKRTELSVDSGLFSVFTSTFSLALGSHIVAFRSIDNVENGEDLKTATVVVVPPLVITLDLDPDTLNLKSQGQFVTAFIEVFGTKTSSDVDVPSLRITRVNDQPLVTSIAIVQETAGKSSHVKFGTIGDHDLDGIPDIMVKFDREALIAVLPIGEQVKITLGGSFKGEQSFSVDGFIRTIRPGAIPAHSGGTAFHPSNARVSIPPSALSSDTDITILKISAAPENEEQSRKDAADRDSVKRLDKPFEFGPDGTRFNAPITLALPYDPNELGDADTSVLRIAYWNPATRNWEPLESVVNKSQRLVSAQTTHFSLYQIVALRAAGANFTMGQVYAFPNPAKRGANPTIHAEIGLADTVDIHIYDISGELIKSGTLSGAPQLIDDGSGRGPQYAYEWTWDVSCVGSGIYIYVVTARKNGQGSLKEIRKVGVIK